MQDFCPSTVGACAYKDLVEVWKGVVEVSQRLIQA